MTVRVCIVTTGQPSTNPRAVKEADALASAGYEVHLIGAQWAGWADQTDARLLASRQWTCEVVKWHRSEAPATYWRTGVRHRLARAAFNWPLLRQSVLPAAIGRVTPELTARACGRPADLFIAHNLGALPAAGAAARRWKARLGFDAEDFHSGQYADGDTSVARLVTEEAERVWLAECTHLTAASPGIAAAYAKVSPIVPTVVRNVFPLSLRPARRQAASGEPLRLYWFSQTIGRERGLEDVVVAMGRLPAGAVELHLQGTWSPGFEAELTKVATASGVSPERLIGHGPIDPDQLVAVAGGYDAGLSLEPGHTRNNDMAQSNKLFTYVLAGLPVIASATSGQTELSAALGDAMWLYPPGDDQALATLLSGLCREPARLGAAREAAWVAGERRFNWDVEQQVLLDCVREVLLDVPGAFERTRRRSGSSIDAVQA